MAPNKQRTPKPWDLFPWASAGAWTVTLAVAAPTYLCIPYWSHLPFILFCIALFTLGITFIISEWVRGCARDGVPELTFLEPLRRTRNGFGAVCVVFLVAAASLGVRGFIIYNAPLELGSPWPVQYGDLDANGINRIFVRSWLTNNTDETITFETYGEAKFFPDPKTRAELDHIVEPLKDDVRRLASGGDARRISVDAHNDTFDDIPGPIVPLKDYNAWRTGQRYLFVAALVYVKEGDEERFAFAPCYVTYMTPINAYVVKGGKQTTVVRTQRETDCEKIGEHLHVDDK